MIAERQFLALFLIFHVLTNIIWQRLKLHNSYFNTHSIPDH